MITRRHLLTSAATGSVLLVAACTADTPTSPDPSAPGAAEETPRLDPNTHQVVAHAPERDLVLPPDALAASRALLSAATAVVVVAQAPEPTPSTTASPAPTPEVTQAPTPAPTPEGTPTPTPADDTLGRAAHLARELGLPLFLDTPDLAAELDRLQTRTVFAHGTPSHVGDREVLPAPATAAEVDLPGLPAEHVLDNRHVVRC